ncbi:MAG: protein translocase subunit SecF [Bdellovibrionales bacterium]
MSIIKKKFNIDFVGKAKGFGIFSIVLVILSLGLVAGKGLNYGIDFAGGTEVQVKLSQVTDLSDVRAALDKLNLGKYQIQGFGEGDEYVVRLPVAEGKTEKEINTNNNALIDSATKGILNAFTGASIRRVDSVGPQIGSELKRNGLLAVFYALLLILIYVGLRFDYEFAPGAVFCLFHDAIITVGIFALLNKEINVQILAAVLTIIGYSLNDTIVNFDRIRENLATQRKKTLSEIINQSINETISRTMLTSITTLLAVAALYTFAGGVIADFAFTLGIGVIVGTYSSIYVASPLILVVNKYRNKTT